MKVNKSIIDNYVNSNIKKMLIEKEYEVKNIDPFEFLSGRRIDILIKYLYVRHFLNNDSNTFIVNFYLENIRAFNQFVEADDTNKVGKDAFIQNFNSLICSVRDEGYNKNMYIPIDGNMLPIDGAHRIAVACALCESIPCVILNNEANIFDCDYFRKRGMPDYYLDYATIKYAEIKSNTYMVLVWPVSLGHDDELVEILNRYGSIINRKNVKMTYDGLVNLQRIVYRDEPWLGSYSNDFEGAHTKSTQCYNENGILRAFLFESKANMIMMKEEIRKVFNLGKHSVHINDSHEETIDISQLIFNDNNIHYLNSSTRKEMRVFESLLDNFIDYLNKNNIDKKRVAVIGGVLALYGIRDAKDLDYISLVDLPSKISDTIELETKKMNYSCLSVSDIINDPRNHINYKGIKFASLSVLLEIKEKRGNDSDKLDASYIRKLLKDGVVQYSMAERLSKFFTISFYRRNIKIFLLKIRYYIYLLKNKLMK